jgi:hypothetical protein
MNATVLNATPTPAQNRAFRFVADRIAFTEQSSFHAGYIHGLIQGLIMASALTVKQACELEILQDNAPIHTVNRRTEGGAA